MEPIRLKYGDRVRIGSKIYTVEESVGNLGVEPRLIFHDLEYEVPDFEEGDAKCNHSNIVRHYGAKDVVRYCKDCGQEISRESPGFAQAEATKDYVDSRVGPEPTPWRALIENLDQGELGEFWAEHRERAQLDESLSIEDFLNIEEMIVRRLREAEAVVSPAKPEEVDPFDRWYSELSTQERKEFWKRTEFIRDLLGYRVTLESDSEVLLSPAVFCHEPGSPEAAQAAARIHAAREYNKAVREEINRSHSGQKGGKDGREES